ncbi:DUF262 domain-containing protein [Thioflexithrix psekupsensis]|uniref:GmrSD restriction endonucleases N-terminal domain-containing protein n=1 Tax=Thioflexithrix psekupsensis TaxID=1570016 RepID=A0A251X5D0_9GAMM|nr:DUF262 domain-containing protein [Thioflexithrix psekupsensis]OUD12555.1 hypothetical protein TPSD3_15835 [Thioflexithrix psekupsensis]
MIDNEDVEDTRDDTDDEEDFLSDSNEPAFDPRKINIATEQNSLATIVMMIKDGIIDLAPEFQRNPGIWTPIKKSLLIESVLLGIPIPAFYFDTSESGHESENSYEEKWLVVDGLQRLSAFKEFIIDQTLELTGLVLLTDLKGLKYHQLEKFLQLKLNRYQVTTFLIRPNTPKEIRYDLFRRINTGGLVLNAQEIRNTLNRGKPAQFLKKLAEDARFSALFPIKNDRMADRELILRYIAFYNKPYTEYEAPFAKFLDKAMEHISILKQSELENIENAFWQALQFIKDADLDINKKRPNKALFEVLCVLLGKLNTEALSKLKKNKENFIKAFNDIKSDKNSEFYKSTYEGTASKPSVLTRFSTIEALIEKYKK